MIGKNSDDIPGPGSAWRQDLNVKKSGEAVATARGRAPHIAKEYGPGYKKIQTYKWGKVDAVNIETANLVELKPNNPKAIRRGEKQLETYKNELEAEYAKPFKGRVETYDP